MYVLCVVMPDNPAVRRFAASTKRALDECIAPDCLAWRLWESGPRGGWCDGTENAWKWIVSHEGQGHILS